jgi:hypothetical protein
MSNNNNNNNQPARAQCIRYGPNGPFIRTRSCKQASKQAMQQTTTMTKWTVRAGYFLKDLNGSGPNNDASFYH